MENPQLSCKVGQSSGIQPVSEFQVNMSAKQCAPDGLLTQEFGYSTGSEEDNQDIALGEALQPYMKRCRYHQTIRIHVSDQFVEGDSKETVIEKFFFVVLIIIGLLLFTIVFWGVVVMRRNQQLKIAN